MIRHAGPGPPPPIVALAHLMESPACVRPLVTSIGRAELSPPGLSSTRQLRFRSTTSDMAISRLNYNYTGRRMMRASGADDADGFVYSGRRSEKYVFR